MNTYLVILSIAVAVHGSSVGRVGRQGWGSPTVDIVVDLEADGQSTNQGVASAVQGTSISAEGTSVNPALIDAQLGTIAGVYEAHEIDQLALVVPSSAAGGPSATTLNVNAQDQGAVAQDFLAADASGGVSATISNAGSTDVSATGTSDTHTITNNAINSRK